MPAMFDGLFQIQQQEIFWLGMMNKEALLLLARFSVRARKFVGHIDSRKLGSDPAYRAEICARIFADGDEETMLMALQLKDQFDYAKFRKHAVIGNRF